MLNILIILNYLYRMLQKETSNKKQQQNKKHKSSTEESKSSSSSKPASSSSVPLPTSTKASTPSSDSTFNYSGGQSNSDSSNVFLNFVNSKPSADTLKVRGKFNSIF